MPHDPSVEAARDELRRSFMTVFCRVLHTSRLPPKTVMALAAATVGSIYKEVADQHRGDKSCLCGWQPNPKADLKALQTALTAMTRTLQLSDLLVLQVVGRA